MSLYFLALVAYKDKDNSDLNFSKFAIEKVAILKLFSVYCKTGAYELIY